MFIPLHTVLPLSQDNQVRVLAIGSEKRSSLAPEVPTLAEAGVTGFEVDLWYAPAGAGGNAGGHRRPLQQGRERDPGDAEGARGA